ncbi:hypothetical protein Ae201684P_009308 [Aphanomyces euteiches]|nr:hypothetical protein Ae201684P_009308 [Aphanomyces euteiches]
MRLFLALVFALSALAAGSRSSLQTRRLASFSRGGEESSQVATSRILRQAVSQKAPPVPPGQIPREKATGKRAYVYYNFSPATHKTFGCDTRVFKGTNPGKSPLGPKNERRL